MQVSFVLEEGASAVSSCVSSTKWRVLPRRGASLLHGSESGKWQHRVENSFPPRAPWSMPALSPAKPCVSCGTPCAPCGWPLLQPLKDRTIGIFFIEIYCDYYNKTLRSLHQHTLRFWGQITQAFMEGNWAKLLEASMLLSQKFYTRIFPEDLILEYRTTHTQS